MTIKTEKELAKALERGDDTIEIEGDLRNKTIKIKATGNVAWAIAIGAIAVAVIVVIGSGGVGAPAAAVSASAAVGILGLGATTSAISIAVAAGGVGVLSKLRKYQIVSDINGKLVLKKK